MKIARPRPTNWLVDCYPVNNGENRALNPPPRYCGGSCRIYGVRRRRLPNQRLLFLRGHFLLPGLPKSVQLARTLESVRYTQRTCAPHSSPRSLSLSSLPSSLPFHYFPLEQRSTASRVPRNAAICLPRRAPAQFPAAVLLASPPQSEGDPYPRLDGGKALRQPTDWPVALPRASPPPRTGLHIKLEDGEQLLCCWLAKSRRPLGLQQLQRIQSFITSTFRHKPPFGVTTTTCTPCALVCGEDKD
nr:unnamed protein product [Digitaria exilis]